MNWWSERQKSLGIKDVDLNELGSSCSRDGRTGRGIHVPASSSKWTRMGWSTLYRLLLGNQFD
jgi:hypothetical protein